MSLIPTLVQELVKIFVGGAKKPPPGRIGLMVRNKYLFSFLEL